MIGAERREREILEEHDSPQEPGGNLFDPSCLPIPNHCPIGVSVTFDGINNDGSVDLDMAFGTNPGDRVNDDIEVVVGTLHPDTLNGGAGHSPRRSRASAATTRSRVGAG